MSKGARRKRNSRPWNNPDALRDISDILGGGQVDTDLLLEGYDVTEVHPDRAEKDYVCPDCGNIIPEGEGHVVVFPDGDPDLRRHWHRHCWRMEVRRSHGAA